MEKYVKPTVMLNDEVSEGVYAASGCYSVRTTVHQDAVENGKLTYRFQVDADHDADHTCSSQTLYMTFNQPVEYQYSNGTLIGSGTGTTLQIQFSYWNNPSDRIGLGEITVTSEPGLVATSLKMTDNG